MQRTLLTRLYAGLFACLLTQTAWADLLINPTRVMLGANDRTTEVTLINISKQTNTYRIGWLEKKASEQGGYIDLTPAQAASAPIASSMIRFSPRQVTLKPGERQAVKLAVTRKQGLAKGEYRSHLQFRAIPPEKKAENEGGGQNMAITMMLSFAIPVVVVQGGVDYDLSFQNAQIHFNPARNSGSVKVQMTRSGANSVIGNISAYWTPAGSSKEVLIAKAGDYNFWPETKRLNAELIWAGTAFAKTDGKLRIVYEGVKEFRGKVFFDKTINVSGSAIKM